MSHSYSRMLRVADQIQQELAELLRTKANDPRFYELTITGVNVSPDMNSATIFVSQLNEEHIDQTLAALNKASGFFRHHLAESLNLRITPRLHFVYDHSVSAGSRLSSLINAAQKKTKE